MKNIFVKQYKPPYKRKDIYYDWIEQLHYEITSLINAINIRNNSAIKNALPVDIINWQEENFAYRVILQLSKLLEKSHKDDDRSFANFLIEIRDKNKISFKQYIQDWTDAMYKSAGLTENDLKVNFENLTEQKATDTCFCKMINNDLNILDKEYNNFKKFRNKILAHLTKPTNTEQIIEYQNITNVANILDKMINKYSQLLYGYYKTHNYLENN